MKLISLLMLSGSVLFLASACVKRQFNNNSETKFALSYYDQEHLKALKKLQKHEKLNICAIAHTKESDSENEVRDSAQEKKIFDLALNAVNMWISPIKESSYWTKEARVIVQNCASPDITIMEFDNVEQQGEITMDRTYTLYTIVDGQTIVINKETIADKAKTLYLQFNKNMTFDEAMNKSTSVAEKDYTPYLDDSLRGVITHEMGHILGLGDAYKLKDYIDNPGKQPPSIMNGETEHGKDFGVSEDDAVSINTIVDYLFGSKKLVCPTGYSAIKSSGNQGVLLFICEKSDGTSPQTLAPFACTVNTSAGYGNVRSVPDSSTSDTVIGKVKNGTVLTVEADSGWYRIVSGFSKTPAYVSTVVCKLK